jgi:hypothetical protein
MATKPPSRIQPTQPPAHEPGEGTGALAAQKREFIETFFKRGAEFTEELIHENERLRYRLLELEQSTPSTEPHESDPELAELDAEALRARVVRLERERDEILHRVRGIEQLNHDYLSRYQEIERENNNLANLYVASHQLHSTLELREVTQIIVEILLNFIGAKTFAVQLLDEERGVLRTLAAEGIERARVPERSVAKTAESGLDVVADAVRSGKAYFGPTRAAREPRTISDVPVVGMPLKIGARVVGIILVWELLSQKSGLVDVDFELFKLLGDHAGSALQSAKLNAELEGPPALWVAADLV